MTLPESCFVPTCGKPAEVRLATRPYCVPHFIEHSYEKIDEYSRAVAEHKFYQAFAEEMWQFVVDCIARSADLTQYAEQLDNLSRARLLDILLRCAELTRYLRRSPRRLASVRVRLRCEKLGRVWEEETYTQVLSRFGAMLECRHPVETGDTLVITRLDTGAEARTRVAWRRSLGEASEIGVELLNCDNFWGFEWVGVEGFAVEDSQSEPNPR